MKRAQTFHFRDGDYTITELAALPECRCKPKTLENRLRSRWTVEAAMTTPRMSKAAAGRKGRLSPHSACSVIPAGETLKQSVR